MKWLLGILVGAELLYAAVRNAFASWLSDAGEAGRPTAEAPPTRKQKLAAIWWLTMLAFTSLVFLWVGIVWVHRRW